MYNIIQEQCDKLICMGIQPSLLLVSDDNMKKLIGWSGLTLSREEKLDRLIMSGGIVLKIIVSGKDGVCNVYGNNKSV